MIHPNISHFPLRTLRRRFVSSGFRARCAARSSRRPRSSDRVPMPCLRRGDDQPDLPIAAIKNHGWFIMVNTGKSEAISVATRSVLEAWAVILEPVSCGFRKATLGTTSCSPQAPCFSVAVMAFWSQLLVAWESYRHDQLQAAGAIRPSLPWCFSGVRGSVLEAWAIILELVSCRFSCRPQAPSVLHCHCASVWRGGPFWKLGQSFWS